MSRKKTTKEFIQDAQSVHGKRYDYTLVNYQANNKKVIIICSEHGEFYQQPCHHLNGSGCPKCSILRVRKKITKSKEEFILKANKVHNKRYDYSKVKYEGAFKKICIICPDHGEFWTRPNTHLQGAKCPLCAREEKRKKFKRHYLLPEYRSWMQMKQRCYNSKSDQYYCYGARGIVVCQRWLDSFENFLKDMGNKPERSYTIDRIDVNGNYEPSNCRWATSIEQANNRRDNKWIIYKGKKYTISNFARLFKVKVGTVFADLRRGLAEEQIINKYENKLNKNYGKNAL